MLPVGWLVLAVAIAVLLTMWVTFTITRLDRLHARVDAAQAALDSQLVRRAAALAHVVETAVPALTASERERYEAVAQTALDADVTHRARELVENAVGRAVAEVADDAPTPAAAELREAAARVLIARRFYNDAVRDTRLLRVRRMPRLLHLAGHRAMPDFFDIDDTLPPPAPRDTGGPQRDTHARSVASNESGDKLDVAPPEPSIREDSP